LSPVISTPGLCLERAGVALRVRRVAGAAAGAENEASGRAACRGAPNTRCGQPRHPGLGRFRPRRWSGCRSAARATHPVFETRFHRTAWLIKGREGAQIEVALDVGEVRALKGINPASAASDCEIELELKSGTGCAVRAGAGVGRAVRLPAVRCQQGRARVCLAHGVANARSSRCR